MKFFIGLFKKPPAQRMAQEELEEAQRKLLEHEFAANYHACMVDLYSHSIERLANRVKVA